MEKYDVYSFDSGSLEVLKIVVRLRLGYEPGPLVSGLEKLVFFFFSKIMSHSSLGKFPPRNCVRGMGGVESVPRYVSSQSKSVFIFH